MKRHLGPSPFLFVYVALSACSAASVANESESVARDEVALSGNSLFDAARNLSGFVLTATVSGTLDEASPYFQSLGTNGRTCGSCHHEAQGWTITPRQLQSLFDRTDGLDPIFLPHDAAVSPNADVSTVSARREAYKLLLDRGVIRIGLPVKPTSEFTLVAVDDPYGFASATQLSLFRRPLPTTNLRFLSTLNWDGRSLPAADPTDIRLGLKNQSNGATVNHAKAAAPIDDATRDAIVDFELQLSTAQIWQDDSGLLIAGGALGGPKALLAQPFEAGPFTLFDAWMSSKNFWIPARREIADGQRVFNEKCSGCHDGANAGSSTTVRFFDIGISSAERRRGDVPLYTFQNLATGETVQTTDPGRALITGKWSDMNRFKVPTLRGLASRAPYFHDGSAQSIGAVIDHYQSRFDFQFADGEKRHLQMFLESL
jgi:hypothetical protein